MDFRSLLKFAGWKKSKAIETDPSDAQSSASGDHSVEATSRNDHGNPVLVLNLGIDFGTSFTKVCFRNAGTEQSEVVNFGESTLESALIPSVVTVGSDGSLDLQADENCGVCRRNLKMKLVGAASMDGECRHWQEVSLDDDFVIRALSSWFLAKVALKARDWIAGNRKELFTGRAVIWTANVGVPVDHCDSQDIRVFDEVFRVAGKWAEQGRVPGDLRSTIERYNADVKATTETPTDCHAWPELAAAVQSFVISREAREGIYLYFDIGGGTVDGVSFNLFAPDGEKSVNFYAGKVESLGISAIAGSFGDLARQIETLLLNHGTAEANGELSSSEPGKQLLAKRNEVQQIVGYVVTTAKKNDRRDWEKPESQDFFGSRERLTVRDQSKMVRLPVFVGGGGANSKWYREAIASTHADFKHEAIKVPPYGLLEVPYPSDLDMNGLPSESFHRFAIAYGLSVPFGEGPEVRLPSELEQIEQREPRPLDVTPYSDSKDVFTDPTGWKVLGRQE